MNNNNRNITVKTDINNPKNQYVNVKLEQDFDELKILSLVLKQSDFDVIPQNSNYGCIVGRAITNGVGIPNARISLFIPLDSNDENNPDIFSIYPFKNITDKDNNDKRFNLLNRIKRLNPFSGFKENNYAIGYTPKTPVGSFPEKVEILSNDTYIQVYKKYYKFTTITNNSGDYMIMGVPIGNQQISIFVDITDIGQFSTPIPVLKEIDKLSENYFNEDGTKIADGLDMSTLPNIKILDEIVNVRPFWASPNSKLEFGFTRKDFNIVAKITPSFTTFFSSMGMNTDASWGERIIFRLHIGTKWVRIFGGLRIWCKLSLITGVSFYEYGINVKRKDIDIQIPKIYVRLPTFSVELLTFKTCALRGGIYDEQNIDVRVNLDHVFDIKSYSACVDDDDYTTPGSQTDALGDITDSIDLSNHLIGRTNVNVFTIKNTVSTNDALNNNFDLISDVKLLTKNTGYVEFSDPGMTALVIPCNRKKVITLENGLLTEVDPNSKIGLFTEFNGYITCEIPDSEISIQNPPSKDLSARVKLRIPQSVSQDLDYNTWSKTNYNFKAGDYYSTNQLYATQDANTAESQTTLVIDIATINSQIADINSQISILNNSKIIYQNELNGNIKASGNTIGEIYYYNPSNYYKFNSITNMSDRLDKYNEQLDGVNPLFNNVYYVNGPNGINVGCINDNTFYMGNINTNKSLISNQIENLKTENTNLLSIQNTLKNYNDNYNSCPITQHTPTDIANCKTYWNNITTAYTTTNGGYNLTNITIKINNNLNKITILEDQLVCYEILASTLTNLISELNYRYNTINVILSEINSQIISLTNQRKYLDSQKVSLSTISKTPDTSDSACANFEYNTGYISDSNNVFVSGNTNPQGITPNAPAYCDFANHNSQPPFDFADEYVNFNLYFLTFTYRTKKNQSKTKVCTFIINRDLMSSDANSLPIGENIYSARFFANGFYFKTNFIDVNKDDIISIYEKSIITGKNVTTGAGLTLKGYYPRKNMNSPIIRFFLGLHTANIIEYLYNKSLI